MIECSTFHNCEIDALYSESEGRELDDEAAAALAEHAKTCPACTARLERLRDNRNLVLSVAVEAVPADFESRIMAAVDEALSKRAAAAPVAVAPAAPSSGGATILRFMARPSFAVAATFVLVLSGAAFMMTQQRSAPMSAMATSSEFAPAAVAASVASPAPKSAEESAPLAVAQATSTAAAVVAMAPAAAAPSPVTGGMPMARSGAGPGELGPTDPALDAAKALAAAGRCKEALPKLEALSASTPEADLHAARCIAKTRGCAAAVPRFDRAAQTNAGTEIGSRAQLEGAKCYQSTGDVVAARKRYAAAKDEGMLTAEAAQGLDELDRKPAAKPGTPSGGSHASPKAVAAPRSLDDNTLR